MIEHQPEHPDQCGRRQEGAGRPRKGWIRVHVVGTNDGKGRWYCSPACAIRALAGSGGRTDVGSCATCTNRHDRDHRCPVCGSRPQLIAGLPTPSTRPQLYQFPIPREDHPA